MDKKELAELKKRLKFKKSNARHIYGCYVNASTKQVVSDFSRSLADMDETETSMYMNVFRKMLSGSMDKSLVNVEIDTSDSETIEAIRGSNCSDSDALDSLYGTIIEAYVPTTDDNYVILLMGEDYDIPGEDGEESENVFRYFLCAICPVKDAPPELAYDSGDKAFRSSTVGHAIKPPMVGFLYPSYAGRCLNLDKAVYYIKDSKDPHNEIVSAVFASTREMTDADRRNAFQESLMGATDGSCDFEVARDLFAAVRDKQDEFISAEDPEYEKLTPNDVRSILQESGMDDGEVDAFLDSYTNTVGDEALIAPSAIMDSSKFEIKNEHVKISIDPEIAGMIKMEVINGRRYILIPAEDGVEVNGIPVNNP